MVPPATSCRGRMALLPSLAPRGIHSRRWPHCLGLTLRLRSSSSVACSNAAPRAELFTYGQGVALPDLRACRHFLNLTNGLEAAPMLHELGLPYGLVRLTSTRCEQQRLGELIDDVDPGLMMALALGESCLVYDFGSRSASGIPRALWYGFEWLRYALTLAWYGEELDVYLRGHTVKKSFQGHYRSLGTGAKRKLQYFGKYVERGSSRGSITSSMAPGPRVASASGGDGAAPAALGRVRLIGVYRKTSHDGDHQFYSDLAQEHLAGRAAPLSPQQLWQPGAGTTAGGGAAAGPGATAAAGVAAGAEAGVGAAGAAAGAALAAGAAAVAGAAAAPPGGGQQLLTEATLLERGYNFWVRGVSYKEHQQHLQQQQQQQQAAA